MAFKTSNFNIQEPQTHNEFLTQKPFSKSGRPKKENKRTNKITIYCDDNEYAKLKERFPNGFSEALRDFLLK